MSKISAVAFSSSDPGAPWSRRADVRDAFVLFSDNDPRRPGVAVNRYELVALRVGAGPVDQQLAAPRRQPSICR